MTTWTKTQKTEAIDQLRRILKPGDTVYTILRHVSASGMSRRIQCVIIHDGELVDITRSVAAACDMNLDRDCRYLTVGGCGMDMGFHVVYNLSYALFPNGHGCTGEGCGSNDHTNGDREYSAYIYDTETSQYKPHWHKEGGYALNHRWI